jgi:DnaK suppressor protein
MISCVTNGPGGELEAARDAAKQVVEDLRCELAAIGESTEASPDDEHDAEGSTVGYERARVGALLDSAEARLARIEAAIVRRGEGGYGRCAVCGRAIPAERLAVLPGVDRCAGCAAGGGRSPLSRRRA